MWVERASLNRLPGTWELVLVAERKSAVSFCELMQGELSFVFVGRRGGREVGSCFRRGGGRLERGGRIDRLDGLLR